MWKSLELAESSLEVSLGSLHEFLGLPFELHQAHFYRLSFQFFHLVLEPLLDSHWIFYLPSLLHHPSGQGPAAQLRFLLLQPKFQLEHQTLLQEPLKQLYQFQFQQLHRQVQYSHPVSCAMLQQ